MAYRRVGRTGLMISEVISGGDPIKLDNYQHLELAIDMGLNYLDMAPAYNRGDCEAAYGKLLAGSSAKRQKVFLTTKISGFNRLREQMYKEIFDGLPGAKREAILKRAQELREQRGVEKPGYYLSYFPNQQRAFDLAYLRVAMMPDYRHQVKGSPSFRKFIIESLETSLKRQTIFLDCAPGFDLQYSSLLFGGKNDSSTIANSGFRPVLPDLWAASCPGYDH